MLVVPECIQLDPITDLELWEHIKIWREFSMPASRNSQTIPECESELAEFSAVKEPSDAVKDRIRLLKAKIGYLKRANNKPILEKRIEEIPVVPKKRGRPRKTIR